MKSKVVSLKEIHFEIGTPKSKILDTINLDVHRGDCIMLIGSNGSGKSSLLKIINGLYAPASGTIDLLESNLLKLPLRKRSQFISTINQDPDLSTFSQLTVYENYLMATMKKTRYTLFFKLKEKDKSTRLMASEYLMDFNQNLCSRLDMPAGKLSGGERQSLGLALCLMHTPELLLLDEHTSALDPASAKRLMEMTATAVTKTNSTAIICTHNLQDALYYGNRLIVMQKGRIVLDLAQEEKAKITKEELFAVYTN